MNIINKFFLQLALLPQGMYYRLGVNPAHLQAILRTKLTMDDRRPNTLQQTRRRKNGAPVKLATLGTMLVSAFIGLAFLISFAIGQNTTTHLLFYFSAFFLMLSASLISDFTAVLIDVRDNYILLPKPVSDRTIVTARILHIFIHICKLVLPMCLPGLVYILMHYSVLGAVSFIVLVLLLTVFVIFFINALYILILRITTPARFQAIISYVQILFAIALYASYQVLPRLIDQTNAFQFDATAHPALFFVPMYWFAAGWNLLYTFQVTGSSVLFLCLSVAVPIGSLYVVIKYLAPSFNNKLALLNTGSSEGQKTTKPATRSTSAYTRFLSRFATQKGAERMVFLFTWKLMARSRDFKVRVYPSIGYVAVLVVLPLLRKQSLTLTQISANKATVLLLSALYVSSFVFITAISQVAQSEKYKAAWMYFIAPIQKPGAVITGALKAALLKFYFPVVALIACASLFLMGPAALPNVALGLCNEVLIAALLVYGNKKQFPFSQPPNTAAKGGAFIKNLLLLLLSGGIALVHFLVSHIMPVVLIFTMLSAIAIWLLFSSIKDTAWNQITTAYTEA